MTVSTGTVYGARLENCGVVQTQEECKHRVGKREHAIFFFGLGAGQYNVDQEPASDSQGLIGHAVSYNRHVPGDSRQRRNCRSRPALGLPQSIFEGSRHTQ